MAALASVHHFCLLSISSISVRRQPPPRCRQMTPWRGIRASTASFVPPFGSRPIIYPENAKRAPVDGSTKPTNRRSNLCEIFSSKKPLLRGNSSYKGGLHPIISPENRKRGVQITSNASRTALTSMLKTVKIGVWKTPERLDAMRFSPHGI